MWQIVLCFKVRGTFEAILIKVIWRIRLVFRVNCRLPVNDFKQISFPVISSAMFFRVLLECLKDTATFYGIKRIWQIDDSNELKNKLYWRNELKYLCFLFCWMLVTLEKKKTLASFFSLCLLFSNKSFTLFKKK